MENFSSGTILTPTTVFSSSSPYEYLVLWYVLSVICCFIGTVSNAICISAFFVNRRLLRKPTYQILFGIFISKFILSAILTLFESTQQFSFYYYNVLIGNDLVCKIETPIYILLYCIINVGQVLCSSCRICAIFAPLFYKNYITTRSVLICQIVLSILVPLVFHLAIWDTLIVYKIDLRTGDCLDEDLSYVSLIIRRTVFMFLPIYMALLHYIIIMIRLVVTPSLDSHHIANGLRPILATLLFNVFYCTSVTLAWWPKLTGIEIYDIGIILWFRFIHRICYSLYPVSSICCHISYFF